MKQIPLAAKVRTIRGSSRSRRLRNTGFVPAEIYGHKETNLSVEVNEKELTKILQTTRGENIFFSLNVDGKAGEPVLAVIKEIQYHKTAGSILHADFHKVNMNEKIRIKVPLRIVNGETCIGRQERRDAPGDHAHPGSPVLARPDPGAYRRGRAEPGNQRFHARLGLEVARGH